MKKILSLCLVALLSVGILAGCGTTNTTQNSGKIKVVATLFPEYDFAKQIGGDKVDVTLLLPPGVDSHTFDPKPADIITIHQSDVFLYTSPYMEHWAKSIIADLPASVGISSVSDGITMIPSTEGNPDELLNPHVWTSPKNAKTMVQNVTKALSNADPANADYYKTNETTYLNKLSTLDENFTTMIANSKRKNMIVASPFSLTYFVNDYGLTYQSAYPSDEETADPSPSTVAGLINDVKQQNIPVVYYEEMAEPKIARTIVAATGCDMLLFHACHNVSKDEIASGATYLSLMNQNLQNLQKGLN